VLVLGKEARTIEGGIWTNDELGLPDPGVLKRSQNGIGVHG
jgi:hypothetical protein